MKGRSKFGIFFGIISAVATLSMATLMTLCLTGKTNIIKKMCTVTFKDENFKVLATVDVKQGEDAHYPLPDLPEKAKNDKNQFKFSTWLPVPNNVKHDMTTYAVYISTDDINDISKFEDKLHTDVDIKVDGDFSNVPIATVTSNLPDKNYLRCNSFGDYSESTSDITDSFLSTPFKYTDFDKTNPYDNPLNYTANLAKNFVGAERMTIKYNQLLFNAVDKLPLKISLPTPQYNVLNTENHSVVYSDNDTYSIESTRDNTYQTMAINLTYSPKDIAKLREQARTLSLEEAQKRDRYQRYAHETYLHVKMEHQDLLNKFIIDNKISAGSTNVMIDAVKALQKYSKRTANIVKTPAEYGGDFVRYFLTENPSGNDQQITIIATLLLRQLGIPTRAVAGLAFDNMFPGKPEQLNSNNITTWLECFVDEVGWILVDPLAGTPAPDKESDPDGGDKPSGQNKLVLRYKNIDREYNGQYVTEEEVKSLFKLEGKLRQDHRMEVEVIDFDEVRDVGKYEFDAKIHLLDQMDQDVSKYYSLSSVKLDFYVNIRPRELIVVTPDYEGEGPYSLSEYDITLNGSLVPGHRFEFEEKSRYYSETGVYTNYILVTRVYDDYEMLDVTSNYIIDYEYGDVIIY